MVLLTFESRDEFLKPLKSRDKFLKFIILIKDSVRTVSVADPGGGADLTAHYRNNPRQNRLRDSSVPFLNSKLKRPQRGKAPNPLPLPGSTPESIFPLRNGRAKRRPNRRRKSASPRASPFHATRDFKTHSRVHFV